MDSSDRFLGASSHESVEQLHEARLVRITHGSLAVWQNPFGMLSPEVVMNLLPEIRDCVGCEHDSLRPLCFDNQDNRANLSIGHSADLCIGKSPTP
jgi:hypothetical protein